MSKKFTDRYKPIDLQKHSSTKAWTYALSWTLWAPVVGTILGAIVGHNRKSEAKQIEKYRQYANAAQLDANNAKSKKDFAEAKQREAEYEHRFKNYKDRNLLAKGSLLGVLAGAALLAFAPVSAAVVIASVLAPPLLGGLFAKYKYHKMHSEAKAMGGEAFKDAQNNFGSRATQPSQSSSKGNTVDASDNTLTNPSLENLGAKLDKGKGE